MSRRTILAIGTTCAALGALVIWTSDSTVTAGIDIEPARQQVTTAGTEAHTSKEAETGTPHRVRVRSEDPAPTATSAGIPRDSVCVRVVHARTEDPVANAEVLFLARTPREVFTTPRSRRTFLEADEAGRYRAFGDSCRTDREGRAWIPLKGWGARCIARLGQASAELRAPAARAGDEFVLRLAPDWTLRVRVTDVQGRPAAGVGVQLERCVDPAKGIAAPFTVGRSDADGVVELRQLQRKTARWRSLADGSHQTRMHLEVLGSSVAGVRLTDARPRPTAIDLVKPPTGRVTIDVRDSAGEPTSDGSLIELRTVELRWKLGGPDTARSCTVLHRRIESGSATFPHVALGLRLQAVIHAAGGRSVHTVRGPEVDGATVRSEIRIPARSCLVSGRAVDARGMAMTGERVECCVADIARGRPVRGRGETDARGRFRIALPRSVLGRELGAPRFTLGSPATIHRASARALGVVRGGPIALGEVRFTTEASSAETTGQLVDAAGRPIAGARGELQSRSSRPGESGWHTTRRFHTDDAGRFGLDADNGSGWRRLRFRAPGFVTRNTTAFLGRGPRRVVLDRAGGLRVAVLAPPDTSPASIVLTLAPAPAASRGARGVRRANGSLEFHWPDLPAGEYALTGRIAEDNRAGTLRGITLRAGETTERSLDLR